MKKIIILTIILFLTGCNTYTELNDLAIINAIGITKNNNVYKLYTSIIEENEKDTLNIETNTYEIEGNSLNEIIANLSLTLNKKIYMSHLDLLLIDETIKTNEFKEIINFFLNNNETREDFLVAKTDNIKKILEKYKFREINDLVEINHKETSKTIYTTMYDIINNYFNKQSIYLTKINDSEHIKVNGLTEFKNNTYKNINDDDAIFINYILNNIETFKYSYNCSNNDYLYLNILKSNTNNLKKDLIIANEIKVITNDCNYTKDEINKIFNNYLKNNLTNYTNKQIIIKNTIRGVYETK